MIIIRSISALNSYIKIARFDHWIKQLFVLPGCMIAIVLLKKDYNNNIIKDIVFSVLSTSFIASANYVINE